MNKLLILAPALGVLAITAPILPAAAQEPAPAPDTLRTNPPLVSKGIFLTRQYRNATFAAVASMGFPGGGQVYNDDAAKFLVALAGLGGAAALFYTSQDNTVRILSGTTFGLVWLWSVGDAYLSAATFNHLIEQQAVY